MNSYVGDFLLVAPVEGHPVGTTAQVTVSRLEASRVVLDFGDDRQVVTDASVLLCGHVGALALLELGYTGPLVRRPGMAGWHARNAAEGHD